MNDPAHVPFEFTKEEAAWLMKYLYREYGPSMKEWANQLDRSIFEQYNTLGAASQFPPQGKKR